jgi:hypothetical protein
MRCVGRGRRRVGGGRSAEGGVGVTLREEGSGGKEADR